MEIFQGVLNHILIIGYRWVDDGERARRVLNEPPGGLLHVEQSQPLKVPQTDRYLIFTGYFYDYSPFLGFYFFAIQGNIDTVSLAVKPYRI